MKARSWTTRFAIVGALLIAGGAIAATPALALGLPTSTSLKSSQNPSSACGLVTFTATVTGGLWPDSPLGLVELADNGSPIGTIFLAWDFDLDPIFGTIPIPTRHSSGTLTVALSEGTHVITSGYLGTDLFSVGGPLVQNVTAATSSMSFSSSANPSVFGQPVSFDTDVSSSCAGSVAGSVQLQADGANLGAPTTLASGHASITDSSLSVGAHPMTATFTSTNPDVLGSTASLSGGPSLGAGLQIVTPADTSTTVSSTPNPSEFGAAVSFNATTTVDSPSLATASGTIQFQDNGADIGAPQALAAGGHASISRTDLSVGSHTISAVFTSSSSNLHNSAGSTSQVVTKARTTLGYDGATSADFNDATVLSGRLTRTDNAAPLAGKLVTLTMGSESCSQVTDASGEAACTVIPSEAAGPFTATASFAGDGNYLNSAAVQPFTVTREETTTVYTGPTVIAQGNPVTLSGRLFEDGATAIAGRTLTLTLGTGVGSQSCVTGPTDVSGSAQCTIPSVAVTQGLNPVKAAFAGDGYYLPSADASKNVIVFAFPSRGIFVLGDQTIGASPVTFWGAQWAPQNILSGGAGPSAFKGFADTLSSKPPVCGSSWTSSPGNSSPPVDTIPAYMGTAVSSSVTKNGATISGNVTKIVVVVTAPGYASDPGHPGTGTVVATYC
jgi:Bacterial Ig-like domain (group 3)